MNTSPSSSSSSSSSSTTTATTTTQYEVCTGILGDEIVTVPTMPRAMSLLRACGRSTRHPVPVGSVTYYPQGRRHMDMSDDMLARTEGVPSIEPVEEDVR